MIRRIDIRRPIHAVMVGLVLAGIVAPIASWAVTNERYKLTHEMTLVAERPSPNLMSKLRYDNEQHASVFNAEGMNDVKDDMKDQLAASVGAGGKKDNQLYTATMPDDPTKGVEVHDNVNDVSVKFVPQMSLLDGRGKNGRVVYPLKDQDGQLIFTPKANGVKEDIVLTSAPKEDVAEYHYQLDLPDTVEARLDETGGIGFYTATPELYGNISYGTDKDRDMVQKARKNGTKNYLMFRIPAPVIRETGKQSEVTARFSLDGKDLMVRATGLLKAHYPLSIDPTFLLTSTSDWVLGSIDDNIDLSVADQVGRQALVGGSTPGWNPNDAPNLAYAQFASSLVAYNGFLYMIGGGSGAVGGSGTSGTTTNDVRYICLNPSTGALGSNGGCTPTTWTQTSLLLTARQGSLAFGFNGYLYAVGGQDNSGVPLTVGNSVEYAQITSTGALSTNSGCGTGWCHGSNLNTVRDYPAGAIYQGVLYVMGGTSGTNNATPRNTIEWARINGDGTVGSWTQSNSTATGNLTSARSKFRGGAYNGYVYITGGQTATSPNNSVLNTTEYAPIQSDGSLGAWVSTTSFPTARRDHGMAINNGYIYVFGGCSGATQACTGFIADTQYAVINADGSVGQWQETVPYNTGGFNSRMPAGVTSYSNHLYFVGGCSAETATNNCGTQLVGTFITDIDTVGRFDRGISTSGGAPYSGTSTVARMGGRSVALNGYLYYIGGCSVSGCGSYDSTVEYSAINYDGSLAGFSTTTALPGGTGSDPGRIGHSLVAYGDKVYVVGGVELSNTGGGGFPSVSSLTTQSFTTNTTTHNVTMPATVAPGDLLLVMFTNDGNATVTTPSGWDSIGTDNQSTNVRGSVFAKAAVGNEDGTNVNFVTSGSEQAAVHIYRIAAGSWYGDTSGVELASVDTGGTSSSANPPSLSPSWGSADTLWLSYAGGSSWDGVSAYPTSFTNGTHTQSNTGTAGASTSSARRSITTGNQDPASFTMTSTESGTAFTIAVRPPAPPDVYMSTILRATQNSGNGTLGSWSEESNSIPNARAFHTTELWHDRIYVLGGRDDSSVSGAVYYSQIGAGGALGSWSTASTGIQARWGHSGGIWGNWIYVVSGQTDTSGTYIGTTAGANAMQRLTINTSTGDISSATGFATNTARRFAGGFVHNGFLYTVGGTLSSSTNASAEISWTALDPSTGAPGTLVTTNIGNRGDQTSGLATARSMAGAVATGGYIYALGGCTSAIANNSFKGCSGFVSTAQTSENYLPNNGGTGQLQTASGSYTNTTALPTATADHATVAYNGYLYKVGGCTGYTTGVCTSGSNSTDIRKAQISPNGSAAGTLGSWSAALTALPSGRSLHQAVAYNGYMYVIGGRSDSSAATKTVYYTNITSTGDLGGTWSNADLPSGADRNSFGAAVSNGYLYVAGGDNGSGTKKNDVYYAQLNTSDGSLATAWATTTAFTTARSAFSFIAYNGKLYVIGGSTSSATLKDIQFASQNTDGTIGSWANTTDVPRGMDARQAVAANGFMYFLGNEGDGLQTNYVNINANGTLGTTQDSVVFMVAAHAHGAVAFSNGFVFLTGGCTLSSGACSSTLSTTSESAGQQAISRTGHYSKLFDTQVDTSPTQLVLNGAINGPGAAVEMKFQTASTSDPVLGIAQLIRPVIFGNFNNVQALNSSGTNVGVAKLYLYVLTLDDSRSGTFPDVPNLSGAPYAQTAVTDITLYYHANPGRRLRHGASFTDTDCNPTPANGCLLDTAP